MAAIAVVLGGVLMSVALGWVGVQGLRGVPDSNGKPTSKSVAIVSLALAGLIFVGSIVVFALIQTSVIRI